MIEIKFATEAQKQQSLFENTSVRNHRKLPSNRARVKKMFPNDRVSIAPMLSHATRESFFSPRGLSLAGSISLPALGKYLFGLNNVFTAARLNALNTCSSRRDALGWSFDAFIGCRFYGLRTSTAVSAIKTVLLRVYHIICNKNIWVWELQRKYTGIICRGRDLYCVCSAEIHEIKVITGKFRCC